MVKRGWYKPYDEVDFPRKGWQPQSNMLTSPTLRNNVRQSFFFTVI